MIIKLSRDQANLLFRESRRKYPVEACGALFGTVNGKKCYVKKIVLLRNLLDSECRFHVDPTEFLEALLEAEKEGLQHIGFFHSHPSNIRPSAVDLEYMRLWPETVWLIISPLDRKMAAYYVIDGCLSEISIKVKNNNEKPY